MKTFFILYWLTFFAGYWAIHSYRNYHRHYVLRHQYAERHRQQQLQRRPRSQMNLFQ